MLEKSAGITQHQGCNSSSYHPLLCLPRFLWQQTEVNLLLLLTIINNTRTVSAATLAGVSLPHTGGVPRYGRAKPSNKGHVQGRTVPACLAPGHPSGFGFLTSLFYKFRQMSRFKAYISCVSKSEPKTNLPVTSQLFADTLFIGLMPSAPFPGPTMKAHQHP